MSSKNSKTAVIVVDLGYGDSGKGSITDYFSGLDEESLVVRFNGGSQAAHRVVMSDGRRHVFSQFGSGMLRPGVRTVLSKYMLVSPLAMLNEEWCLNAVDVRNAFERTDISEEALIISPYDRAANRLREIARNDGRHGTCGQGIGETASYAASFPNEALRAKHLGMPGLRQRLERIQEHKRVELANVIASCHGLPEAAEYIECLEDPSMSERWINLLAPFVKAARILPEDDIGRMLLKQNHLVFEGAQGVLLDEWRGFHPYTTWSTCTFDNAIGLLGEYGWNDDILRLGVTRAYATRHGAGPFPTEDAEMSRLLPDSDNVSDNWQGNFRVGWLDMVALRYAIAGCGGIDALAVTCLDRLEPFSEWMVCNGYETPDGVMRELPLGIYQDLDHQAVLTKLMTKAKPMLDVTTDQEYSKHKAIEHALAIEHLLDESIGGLLISTGPTCEDKRIVR